VCGNEIKPSILMVFKQVEETMSETTRGKPQDIFGEA